MTGIHRRMADEVYARLREQIVTGARAPGDKLDPTRVAADLDVSRTPVREAILRLDAEGFVHRLPYKGVVVSAIDLAGAADVAALRLQLETLAVRTAVPRLTDPDVAAMRVLHDQLASEMRGDGAQESFRALNKDFHLALYRAAGSSSLLRMIEDLANQADRFRLHFDVRHGRAMADHADILAGCEARDVGATVAATRKHLLGSYLLMLPDGESIPAGSLLDVTLAAEPVPGLPLP
ncbi:GntR family transcriptional regulator [Actinoplanes sp. NPDC051851]|uniref:GntR family transcriptional regulator n=1 Tax=Actinoplanes sp. NPDC051851 TaxID=3154753 RepID=UPI003421DA29